MIVSDLVVHPVKGCGGYSVAASAVDLTGLRGDRMMMLVDDDGVFLSQRKVPEMAALRPYLSDSSLFLGGNRGSGLWISRTADWACGRVTKLPERRRRSIRPFLTSSVSALFTVMREQSYSFVSSCSKGIR